jgi:hypothetical protein
MKSQAIITKVCSTCGSESVLADAYAEWNKESQKWELLEVFDKGHFCHDCDGDCSIKDVEIDN